MSHRIARIALIALPALTLSFGAASAGGRRMVDYVEPAPASVTANITPADVEAARASGIAWLKEIQRPDGGWGAGDWSTEAAQAPSDVATTSLTVLAMLRDAAGSDKHDVAIGKAIGFVSRVIEESPIDSARLNGPEGTQPQYKLGQLVDTHMAAMMLGEVEGHFDGKMAKTVAAAHDKVLIKVQMAQNSDGSFDSNGWAPVLSTSIAQSSLERALELGKDVDGEVLAKNDAYQRDLISDDGSFNTAAGAGVDLYAAATSLKGNRGAKKRATSAPARQQAEDAEEAARTRITGDSSGALFNGFGSVGGEEMLSYMMISDTLAEDGGDEFSTWNDRVGQWLVASQNTDGSWSGHHCITSRTFTTAGALMALGADDWAKVRASRITHGTPDSMHADASFAPDHKTAK